MGPSPMLYFAVATLGVDGGIQVTGSHNPADYNGFKMLLNGRSVFGEEIQALGRRAEVADWIEGAGRGHRSRRYRRLCRRLAQGFRWPRRSASAGTMAMARAARFSSGCSSGSRASITRSTPRSTAPSPTITPIPTVEANLADLKALVADKKLDFGIAFDGDADRIGAVDGEGRVIWGDQLLMVLADPVLKDLPWRDDYRRRQGQPDPVRPHRRDRRHAADVEDRPQPDQVEDEGNRLPAGGRDERPHLLQAPMVRLRRRALRRRPPDPRGRRKAARR